MVNICFGSLFQNIKGNKNEKPKKKNVAGTASITFISLCNSILL